MRHFSKKRIEDRDLSRLQEPRLTFFQRRRFLEGIERFNRRLFWEAHECWEEVWKECSEESRIFFQGIIQVAAAYHLILVKRRFVGARNNFEKSLSKLNLFQ